MIRFPNRFHASRTPGASRIAPDHYLSDPPDEKARQYMKYHARAQRAGKAGPREKCFDFSVIRAVLG